MSAKKLKILTLFVQYGDDNHPTALPRLQKFFEDFSSVADFEWCVIENQGSLQPATPVKFLGGVKIGGDNSYFEFSAWDRALQHFGPRLAEFDYLHFVTSAFNLMYSGYLEHFVPSLFEPAFARELSLGHVDIFPKECELYGQKFNTWIRTCFFFIPTRVITRVLPLAYLTHENEIFSGDPDEPFLPHAPTSAQHRYYLQNWLTGKNVTAQWHSTFELNTSTYPKFVRKMMAIYNEHHLTIRLTQAGLKILDVGYSFTQGHRVDLDHLPHLASQVMTRKGIVGDPTYFL